MYLSTRDMLIAQEVVEDRRRAVERERLLRTVLAHSGAPGMAERFARARREVFYRLGGRFVAWGEGLQKQRRAGRSVGVGQ